LHKEEEIMKIIDARVRLRTEQLLKPWTTELKPFFKDYITWYKMQDRLTVRPVEEQIEYAAKAGVEKLVVCGGSREDNEHIIELAERYDAIIPVAGANVSQGILEALKEIKRCENQVAAINLSPFIAQLNANDKKLYPIYGLCELLGKPIIVHGSLHYWRGSYMWHGHPQYFDEVAVDFPELKLIISHGGNGFGPPVLAVAQRHPNVYLEFSALRPKYMAPEFIQAANTYLKKKCIFGTDYPLIEYKDQIELWKYALRENVWDLFFRQNILDALYREPVPLD
jgi:predicted TIM-barrel fold metal-dependent hydrolase